MARVSALIKDSRIPGGSPEEIEQDYGLEVDMNDDGTFSVEGDQKDVDSLPPYEILDAILEAFIEEDCSVEEIVGRGFARETVLRVLGMVRRNEYKRRQAPPGVRISRRAFGRDWRYPITNGYRN